MKIVTKCDMGGYIIEPEKYNRNQIDKQIKYNTTARFFKRLCAKTYRESRRV